MYIGKLKISYDRGTALNRPEDLGTDKRRGTALENGKVVRGLGSHFRSEAEAALVKERDQEAKRIYTAVSERFLRTNIDGLYLVKKPGQLKAFVAGLNVRDDVKVRVSEWELTPAGTVDQFELAEWAERIKNQLAAVQLGRGKEIDEDGLRALETLASAPILKASTGARVKALVANLRAQKITRVELKRGLETLNVEIDDGELLAPRRGVQIQEAIAA